MKIRCLSGVEPWGCSLCSEGTSPDVIGFEDVPYLLGVTQKPSSLDRTASFNVGHCPNCGLVQHNHDISGEMYSEIHSHAVGKVWNDHFGAFTAFIGAGRPQFGRVLEIGPSSSPMARGLPSADSVTYVDFMDTAPFALRPNEQYHAGYFPHAQLAGQQFDIIIASHVLEHAPKLNDFFGNIVQCLSDRGTVCLSIPDFASWIGRRYWNAFSLEHVTYPVEAQIAWLSARWQLEFDIDRFADHSMFIRFRRGQARDHGRLDMSLWSDLAVPWCIDINGQIASFEQAVAQTDLHVYLVGASHLSQYVLSMSEQLRGKCRGVFDNATAKHGQRLYGSDIKVHAFDELSQLGEVAVIVPRSPYEKEICAQIAGLNARARIVVA